ncbi:MAG: glycoside hydrolase family 5 protein [Sphaerochaetaceae bacterium]|nr:glycoside hydrolase family 5 protein [Sphaerochaetaceae bacterium]
MKIFKGFQKGVNLGGWISQFAKYEEEHFRTFITEKDIQYIASLGFDHVRVPVDYNVLEDEEGHIKPSGFGYLESCRSWCEKYGLNMLIDLHECYGYSFDPLKKDMDRRKFFYDEALQARFFALWTEIANRFKAYPNQVAFEPLNEVVLTEVVDAWNEVATKFVKLIRSICPTSYIIIGGVNYNAVLSVPKLRFPVDEYTVYNFHCYEPHIFTHQAAYWVFYMPSDFRIGYPKTIAEYREASRKLTDDETTAIFAESTGEIGVDFFDKIFAPAIEAAKKADVPLYCGEYGVIDLADNEDKIRWLNDIHAAFRKYGIGHALWNYKEKDFGFVDERFVSIKDKFIQSL